MSKPTTLRYYQSANNYISPSDVELGWGSRDPLTPNNTIERYLIISAPATPGVYYYGVCVDVVDDESNSFNNCSQAIKVTVDFPKDVDANGTVDVHDLVRVAQHYGQKGNTPEDINGDWVVDIQDLILVAEMIVIDDVGDIGEAPALRPQIHALFTTEQLQALRAEVKAQRNISTSSQKGLALLEQLFRLSPPKNTSLLPNYPNPFNPETWIPYQLAAAADVTVTIYDVRGVVVRRLALGHQPAGFYHGRGRAAHWDGRNQLGEKVASGLYFYTFTADNFTATQKLLIRK